jgi:acetyl-CoA carboxylase carboxyltransferase component
MSDETVIVNGTGTIFLGGPPLVKAATGEEVTAEELGGADVHTRQSGVADYFAEDDEHALQLARTIVGTLHTSKRLPADMTTPEAPRYDAEELYGIVSVDPRRPFDVHEVIARIVDGSRFDEFKQRTVRRRDGICPFARIPRRLSPTACSRSRRSRRRTSSSVPARHPGSFQNITGFMVGRQHERGGTPWTARRWFTPSPIRRSESRSTGGSFGAGNYGMVGQNTIRASRDVPNADLRDAPSRRRCS